MNIEVPADELHIVFAMYVIRRGVVAVPDLDLLHAVAAEYQAIRGMLSKGGSDTAWGRIRIREDGALEAIRRELA